jgi:hypothetical protein
MAVYEQALCELWSDENDRWNFKHVLHRTITIMMYKSRNSTRPRGHRSDVHHVQSEGCFHLNSASRVAATIISDNSGSRLQLNPRQWSNG